MEKIETKININLKKYGWEFADRVAQLAAAEVVKLARKYVAKDTKDLMNSIIINPALSTDRQYVVSSGTEYGAAQEWGRPDIPNYTFTSYMRPAAAEAQQPDLIRKYVDRAQQAAENIAKVRG